jgi:Mn-containing catalase
MFYMDGKLQYPVRVERPNPVFARALQQAIGGVEGEIRVCLQYMFQGWGSRGPAKYRDMLLNTGTEEIGHIEMLATAVALNLEKAPLSFQEEAAANPVAGSVLNGMNLRHILSTGLRRRRRMPTASRSTAAMSMPAATSPGTCWRTPRRRPPAARSRSGCTA